PRPPDPGTRSVDVLAQVTEALPSGEMRPQQVRMCRAVATALATGRHLIVEAGTGTGKSLAYSVPAACSGKSVVVATATKALQDQLANKDLPLIVQSSASGFTFAVLKGRANYICRQRIVEIARDGIQQSLTADAMEMSDADDVGLDGDAPSRTATPVVKDRVVDQVRKLVQWAKHSVSGDRADLPFEPHDRAWSMVSVGPRECPGAFHCPSGGQCFAERARSEAARADIVVVNTHLYGAHLASGGAVLPEHDVVIFDEAHELEEIMTASLGVEISPGRFRSLARAARLLAAGDNQIRVVDDVGGLAQRWQDVLTSRLGQRVFRDRASVDDAPENPPDSRRDPAGRSRARIADPTRHDVVSSDGELSELIEVSLNRVQRLFELIEGRRTSDGAKAPGTGADIGVGAGAGTARDVGSGGGTAASTDAGRWARTVAAAGHLTTDLHRVAAHGEDEVVWVDGSQRLPVLRLSPIDVGPVLGETLWGGVTAVLTSATIPPRLADRIGIPDPEVDKIDVGSPFDYRAHALLYVARHLPDRRDPASDAALHDELVDLIGWAGGRTLALFTSRRATEAAAAAARARLTYDVLVQNDLPKALLLEQFAENETSCLFATLGFWQGVDVPGRSLSLVTLDRLPFARPDDPLFEARRERAGSGAFRSVDLPRVSTLLAQGSGRLIRSAEDRGVVAVLDPRLATAGYRGVLLAALPPMRRTTDRRQVEAFLKAILTPKK
ncbi:MAG: ATP-dependent DNA helicase, partial [Acidimicrobiales bacterium]